MPTDDSSLLDFLLAVGGGMFLLATTLFAVSLPTIKQQKRGRTEFTAAAIIGAVFTFCAIALAVQTPTLLGIQITPELIGITFFYGPVAFAILIIYALWILSGIDEE